MSAGGVRDGMKNTKHCALTAPKWAEVKSKHKMLWTVGFEGVTAVLWIVAPCSVVGVY